MVAGVGRRKGSYRLWLEPELHALRDRLPGNVRQRVKRALDDLAADPHPAGSQPLDLTGLDLPPGVELRRLRLGKWRIIYAVNAAEGWVWALGIRHRPPYNYDDLPEVVSRLGH
jgi:mRNA interferase RelE/StbE